MDCSLARYTEIFSSTLWSVDEDLDVVSHSPVGRGQQLESAAESKQTFSGVVTHIECGLRVFSVKAILSLKLGIVRW